MNELKIKLESIQSISIAIATGGYRDEVGYETLRADLLNITELKNFLPEFLHPNRSSEQFWQFIKIKFSTYAERKKYIWDEFAKSLDYVESNYRIIEENISKTIEKFNQDYINSEWGKALKRKNDDPEAAITTARSLIETTCKFILDDLNETYEDDLELPKLYKLTADKLNLAPDQHTEQIFKQILGGCQTVVVGLGALRNKLSDSHGKKISTTKASSRHAVLAVNLAGTMTTFLLETYEFKIQKSN